MDTSAAGQDWVELAVAPDQVIAEMWQEYLADQGIAVRPEAGDITSYLGVSTMPVRLLVAEDDLDQAQELLEAFESEGVDQATLEAAALDPEYVVEPDAADGRQSDDA